MISLSERISISEYALLEATCDDEKSDIDFERDSNDSRDSIFDFVVPSLDPVEIFDTDSLSEHIYHSQIVRIPQNF